MHQSHKQFIPPSTSTNYYISEKLLPNTITDMNSLLNGLIESSILDEFSYHLKFRLYSCNLKAEPNINVIMYWSLLFGAVQLHSPVLY